jgi:hypothetical protein
LELSLRFSELYEISTQTSILRVEPAGTCLAQQYLDSVAGLSFTKSCRANLQAGAIRDGLSADFSIL